MPFNIRMGVPQMAEVWTDLSARKLRDKLDKKEKKFFKKFVKVLGYLSENPRHPSLQTHEIDDLTDRYGFKVFEAYLENNTPSAGRVFWAYGPDKGDITVLGVEPHPDDKKGAYGRIKLSGFPPAKPKAP
ncbi:MAG TPA: hypothetical protein VN673_15330 [Clostridia bacterium]|nr:hypothetical protein [Clostridia bacterium]